MSFRGLLRPGQGFRPFVVLRKEGGTTDTGRAKVAKLIPDGEIYGIISQASQQVKEQWKQEGHPITHTVLQRGAKNRAKPMDVLNLKGTGRKFMVKGVNDPGELGHFTVYHVEEREDLQ